MSKDEKPNDTVDTDWGAVPIATCQCGSTDYIQRPSGSIICRHCSREMKTTRTKVERP